MFFDNSPVHLFAIANGGATVLAARAGGRRLLL
jgi:hypothetical protein